MLVTRVACPRCQVPVTLTKPVEVGKTLRCPKCAVPFTVVAEPDPAPATPVAPSQPPAPLPEPAPVRGKISLPRLASVAGGTLLFLGMGLGLGAYCFSVNKAAARKGPASISGPEKQTPIPAAPERPLITLPQGEQVKVDQAIIRGVRYLKTTQQPNGTWSGSHPVGCASLPGLVLLQCGLPANDPTVQKAADFVRANSVALTETYDLALAILFLDQLGEYRDKEPIRTLALRLVAAQTVSGGWNYNCPVLQSQEQAQLLTTLKDVGAGSYAQWKKLHPVEEAKLPPALKARAVFQDPAGLADPVFKSWAGDNSNTQFAILALWAARRHDIPLERTVALLVKRYRTTQNPDGSWHYNPGQDVSPPWPTMTCAGLLGLAIGHGVMKEGQEKSLGAQPAIDKAFLRLGQQIGKPRVGPTKGPKAPLANLYFLWSVERVAVLFNRKTIADKDWYAWGAEMLLDHQDEARGNWQNGGYPGAMAVIDTCFALLFLKQANLAKDLTSKLQLLAGAKTTP